MTKTQLAKTVSRLSTITERLRAHFLGRSVIDDLAVVMQAYALDVAQWILFNVDSNYLTDPHRTNNIFDETFFAFGERCIDPLQTYTWGRFARARDKHVDKLFSVMSRAAEDSVLRCMENKDEMENPTSAVALLIKAYAEENSGKTDIAFVREQAQLLLNAGYETTNTAMMWCLAYLTFDPEGRTWVDRIRKEVASYVNKDGIFEQGMDADSCHECKAFISEVLRLRPPFPMFMGRTACDVEIDGVTVPKGVDVSLLVRVPCSHDGYFSRASEFLPERWLSPRDESKFPLHDVVAGYSTWGSGVKACLGRPLAMLEIVHMIAMMVTVFELAPSAAGAKMPDEEFHFSLRPASFSISLKRK